MKKIILSAIFTFSISLVGIAQVQAPTKTKTSAILLRGGVAHLGNGEIIENSLIGFDKGKIILVADARTTKIDPTIYTITDISGQHVYPGFILPNTNLGLEEVSALEATKDANEVGQMNPNIRSLIAYNTDSKIIPTLRFNGILIAETTPGGGRITGTSSIMNLDGWNWEDAVLKENTGIHLNWPPKFINNFDHTTATLKRKINEKYSTQVAELANFFENALTYNLLEEQAINLKMEALEDLFTGKKTLFIRAKAAKEIIESVRFAQTYGVQKIVVLSGLGALEAVSFLVENNIPVILPNVHRLPNSSSDEIDLPFKLASLLTKAGITTSLSHNGLLSSARNLPFYAGTTAAYGLNKEEALTLITLNAAKILGIDQEVGSLEQGKKATLFVSKGDALDMITNMISLAYIDGKKILLEGDQQILHKKYMNKYFK